MKQAPTEYKLISMAVWSKNACIIYERNTNINPADDIN